MISIFKPKTSLLLALLVITGLAGRPSFKTISGAERRFLTHHLRTSRAELLHSIKGLSDEQLNYKPAPGAWSVKECIQHLSVSENELWAMTETVIKQPENGKKWSKIKTSDEKALKSFADYTQESVAAKTTLPEKAPETTKQSLEEFKQSRYNLIKFVRSTTDNLRDHVKVTPSVTSDAYQLILMISAQSQWYTMQIENLKKTKGFPKE